MRTGLHFDHCWQPIHYENRVEKRSPQTSVRFACARRVRTLSIGYELRSSPDTETRRQFFAHCSFFIGSFTGRRHVDMSKKYGATSSDGIRSRKKRSNKGGTEGSKGRQRGEQAQEEREETATNCGKWPVSCRPSPSGAF